ncbi:MAG: pyruvate kinase alpha/beta domain-containing protein [Methanosarcinales archaeon]
MEKPILYFEKSGEQNTNEVVSAVKTRAMELNIKHVVVASTTGSTGIKVAEAFKDTDVKVIVVTNHYGFVQEGEWLVEEDNLKKLQDLDATVMTQTHALSGVERSLSNKVGGASRVETIAAVIKSLFGIGFKVAIEVTIMASDSGAIPVDKEVIAIGGTRSGADVAVVIQPANANNFFKMQIREIIAMPRVK